MTTRMGHTTTGAVVLLMVLAAATGAFGRDDRARARVAVLDFQNQANLPDREVDYIADLVRGAVRKELPNTRYIVMTRDNIFDLLPQGTKLAACIGECAVQTGRNIGADYVITGDVVAVAGQLRVKFTLYGTADGNLMDLGVLKGRDIPELEAQVDAEVGLLVSQVRFQRGGGVAGSEADLGAGVEIWTPDSNGEVVVVFASEPAGATVEVDGMPVCTTPANQLLAPGRHEIAMKMPRYLPEVRNVQVGQGMAPVAWTLDPNFGQISVSSTPSGLPVKVDGWAQGVTPLAEYALNPGVHQIVIDSPSYHRIGRQVVIERGDNQLVNLTPVPRRGALKIMAYDQDGAAVPGEVYVDEEPVGWTFEVIPMTIGHRLLRVRAEGGCWSAGVAVTEEVTRDIHITMELTNDPQLASDELKEMADKAYWSATRRADRYKDLGVTTMLWGVVGGAVFQYQNLSAQNKEAEVHDCLVAGVCVPGLEEPALSSKSARTLRNISWAAAGLGLITHLVGRSLTPDSQEEILRELQRKYPCAVDVLPDGVRVSFVGRF